MLNVTGLREGKRLQRRGQRAFDLWKYAFRPRMSRRP